MSRITEALARAQDAKPRREADTAADLPWQFEPMGTPEPSPGPALDIPWNLEPVAPPPTPAQPAPSPSPSLAPRVSATAVGDRAERLLTYAGLPPGTMGQFRKLGAILHQAQSQQGIRSIMVSSALPAEGKTFVACNIALTLSRSFARRVLLIDADLRRPAVHTVFGLDNTRGLSNWLDRERGEAWPTQEVSPGLTVLVAGSSPIDPLRIVVSEGMQRLVKEAEQRFDWVVVDTPPVGLLPDAHILGSMVDTCLMVIRSGTTPYPAIQKAIETIGRERIIGTVLNAAPESQAAPNGAGYDGYYGRYEQRFEG